MRQSSKVSMMFLCISSFHSSGCVSLQDKASEKKQVEAPAAEAVSVDETMATERNALRELELKQARLWARIDELEALVLKQQQRVRILEQAILIDAGAKKSEKPVEQPSEKKSRPTNEGLIKEHTQVLPQQNYQNKLLGAQVLFNKKKWNQAFLAFSSLNRETDFYVSHGEPVYWLARCWLQMQELQTSKEFFARFLEMSPQHPLASSAQSYFMQVEMALNEKRKLET